MVGNETSEADIRYALGRERRKDPWGKVRYKHINEDDFQGEKRRNLNFDVDGMKDDDLVIEYIPVKFQTVGNVTEE